MIPPITSVYVDKVQISSFCYLAISNFKFIFKTVKKKKPDIPYGLAPFFQPEEMGYKMGKIIRMLQRKEDVREFEHDKIKGNPFGFRNSGSNDPTLNDFLIFKPNYYNRRIYDRLFHTFFAWNDVFVSLCVQRHSWRLNACMCV